MKQSHEAPPLKASNLSKTYGHSRGIEALNFTVEAGEIVGFLGPNGAGKSTTIRTIMNFQRPSAGSVALFGFDSVHDSTAIKSRIGYLAGELALYEELTGRQFLGYLASFNKQIEWSYVEALAKRFDGELDRKMKELSKGNRQKIGIIQAFMHHPDLVILDEPTSGLDPLMQEEFFRLLEECKERGASVFFSSHTINEIQRVADRAAFIKEGKLIGIEDVKKLRDLDIHRLQVHFGTKKPDEATMKRVAHVDEARIKGSHGVFVIGGSVDAFIKALAHYDVLSIDREATSLEDIFLRYYEQPINKEAL